MSGEIAETLNAAFGKSHTGQYAYKTMPSWSQNNSFILLKIVKYLKERHLSGDTYPLTLEEILDETEQTDISARTKTSLETDLEHNPKVRAIKSETAEGSTKYQFRPVIDVRDRKGLKKYLQEKYQSGEAGTWLEDILESVPRAEAALKWLLANEFIIVITRQNDKKKVVYYNEGKQDVAIDEDFINLWRSISVEGVADDKIQEYLEKHGIQSIKDLASKKMEPTQKRRKLARRQNKNFKAHNDHMKEILEDYSQVQ